ncbi:hypothetical protein FACS18942_04640 [Planctomycetales bacterium]|nr:hypothetical protein FACS18942_04640 [Planctomycetales bacterium]
MRNLYTVLKLTEWSKIKTDGGCYKKRGIRTIAKFAKRKFAERITDRKLRLVPTDEPFSTR